MKQRKRRFSSSLRCGPAQLLARGRIGLDLPKICFHRRAVPVNDVVLACLKSNLARLACFRVSAPKKRSSSARQLGTRGRRVIIALFLPSCRALQF
eukprot:COSAG06_NODE_367_length_16758_cov_27.111651_4_plen_96_part_00